MDESAPAELDEVTTRIASDPVAVRRVLEAAGLLTMSGVAELLGISYYRVKMLRATRRDVDTEAFLGGADPLPRPDALPAALPLPGDPLWHPEDVRLWGRQTGRIDQSGRPRRAKPTGRPRKDRRRAA